MTPVVNPYCEKGHEAPSMCSGCAWEAIQILSKVVDAALSYRETGNLETLGDALDEYDRVKDRLP